MVKHKLRTIACRTLNCVSPSGTHGEVRIEITVPCEDRKSNDWTCYIRLTGSARFGDRSVHGVDSLQCLMLAVAMLRAQLQFFEKQGFRFSWLGNEGVGLDE